MARAPGLPGVGQRLGLQLDIEAPGAGVLGARGGGRGVARGGGRGASGGDNGEAERGQRTDGGRPLATLNCKRDIKLNL